jgi:hypothetical protein
MWNPVVAERRQACGPGGQQKGFPYRTSLIESKLQSRTHKPARVIDQFGGEDFSAKIKRKDLLGW